MICVKPRNHVMSAMHEQTIVRRKSKMAVNSQQIEGNSGGLTGLTWSIMK